MIKDYGDLDAVMKVYSFIIRRIQSNLTDDMMYQWIDNIGNDMCIISKMNLVPAQNFPPVIITPVIITYGFKREDDAIAFALRFGSI